MATLFQLGVLLPILGAVQCKERLPNDKGLEVYTYERDLQEGGDFIGFCPVCKTLVGEVFKMIGNEVSKNSIEQALDKVCENLKHAQSICKRLVHKYREKLVRFILSARQPHDVCKEIKLCKAHGNKV